MATRIPHTLLLIVFLVISLAVPGASTGAQTDSSEPLRVTAEGSGVRLEWSGGVALSQTDSEPVFADWPIVEINGLQVPAQLVALRVPDQASITPQIDTLDSRPWTGTLPTAEVPIPRTPAGDERPALAEQPALTLPTSPVVVLREGRMRGTRIVVLAISPIFEQNGSTRAASNLQITIPGATLLSDDAAQHLTQSTPFLSSAPAPLNPVAARAIVKISVAQAGIQRVPGSTLAAAGVNLSALNPSRLQLWHNGEAVALEEAGTRDGRLDPADELRFYAPAPGDRWNATDTYWLTVEATSGLRMTSRNAAPGTAPLRTTAFEQGVWQDNRLYDPTLPGPDGDHWYAADLRIGPKSAKPSGDFAVWLPIVQREGSVGTSTFASTLTVPLTPTLPLVPGTAVLTVTGSAYTAWQHNLAVHMGTSTATASWNGVGNWTQAFTLADNVPRATLNLIPGSMPDGIQPDSVSWKRPVRLDFGRKGAFFVGVAGIWRYELNNIPADRTLYDVSAARQPVRLTIPSGPNIQFEDGPAPRQYVLTGPGTLHTPAVSAYSSTNLAAPLNANVLYIAPKAFQSALQPLVARRQAQGYTTRVVDVQAIYDWWSFGQVAPAAIRDFLRYAAATWNPAPQAVVLVGDGTADPRDYLRKGEKNVNLVPPYLAMVDPYQGETACETCYVQLDGADPVASADADVFPDLAVGRLPVKSSNELEQLVTKITGYETDNSPDTAWRSRNLYIADNYYDANGVPDRAGDFALFSDQSAALQPAGMEIQRVYYDPWKKASNGTPLTDPWREPDAAKARQRVQAAISAGVGLVNYTGHSNHWRWAVTDDSETNHLLSLFEADTLTNGKRLPIVLGMTCWTSAFQTPAVSGTTLDERLLLHTGGGAVAVWGPAGLGVSHGHEALQRGFYRALWNAPPMQATLGTLTLGGYLELLTRSACCQDAVQTYVLLGDPLTPARVRPGG